MSADNGRTGQTNAHDSDRQKRIGKQNKKMGYMILYLAVLLVIIVGEIILFKVDPEATVWSLLKDAVGNLMGVLAAFLVFDLAHEKISKDIYASEVSEQILDTLMYHPEAMELYENEQKKVFVNSFIGSIVGDEDVSEMINNHVNNYLLTEDDFKQIQSLTEKDCRIRTAFSYRFVLDTERTKAFSDLRTDSMEDPYFYVQEELNYTVKYLSEKGNNTKSNQVKIGMIYDNAVLDRFLRGNKSEQENAVLRNCIFRENLDIEEADKQLFRNLMARPQELTELVCKMFRPHLTIDRFRGKLTNVEVGTYEDRDYGLIMTFDVDHDGEAMTHDVDIIFHMPKKWNGAIEVALVEPTKEPKISVSYNEDAMDVEMFSFLNKGESSAYENTLEDENGVYSISLCDEWVFPISGVIFLVRKDLKN
jgi:hypothetical protein